MLLLLPNVTIPDINECYRTGVNPCQNNADCINTDGLFYCNCTEGFEGSLCETSKERFV